MRSFEVAAAASSSREAGGAAVISRESAAKISVKAAEKHE